MLPERWDVHVMYYFDRERLPTVVLLHFVHDCCSSSCVEELIPRCNRCKFTDQGWCSVERVPSPCDAYVHLHPSRFRVDEQTGEDRVMRGLAKMRELDLRLARTTERARELKIMARQAAEQAERAAADVETDNKVRNRT